jgi:DNA-binding CsgD family transcriptional regulator
MADGNLTPRQKQVAFLLVLRLSNREIAERLAISEHTVKRHVEMVLLKLGVGSRRQLATMASQLRATDPAQT